MSLEHDWVSPDPAAHTIYFAYGSDIYDKHYFSLRCPGHRRLGIGRLRNWRWIINDRGCANIVPLSDDDIAEADAASEAGISVPWYGEVWGVVYAMTPSDEAALDNHERVDDPAPFYTKGTLQIDYWPVFSSEVFEGMSKPLESYGHLGQPVQALVYVDRQRTVNGTIAPQVNFRMHHAIKRLLRYGVPEEWVNAVPRRSLLALSREEADAKAWEKERQVIRGGVMETRDTIGWRFQLYDLAWRTLSWDCAGLKLPPPSKRTAALVLCESLWPFSISPNW